MRTRNVRATVAILLTLTVGTTVAGCGTEGESPLDTVRALETDKPTPTTSNGTGRPTATTSKPPRRTTTPTTDGPTSSGSATPSTSGSATGTAAPATGVTAPYINDPCRLLTVAEVASLTGLAVVRAEVDPKLKSSSSSFCDYRDSRGLSMMTVMMTTNEKSYYKADESAKGTIDEGDNPVAVPGVGDAAFTYHDSDSNGIVWAKDMPGDRFLNADLYVDRSDKDLQPDVMAAIARTMIGKL
ncbi:DUF3558 family protein [Embleya sp. NBC_00896]|uniref:DUF3558 family protein n=1 Tax=Embleya sp. NBC_00896 TaxID=2975961 RepID=UPI00386F8A05|nr:DUF3558 domain-containing protein [Embleya sp. NBC_00896]